MSVRFNVAANFAGQAWRAAIQLAFVPVYVRYLGVEAYGLIGMFAVLQASLAVLDFGMRPALAREMARFAAGATDVDRARDLLRTVELGTLAIAAVLALGIWLGSAWMGHHWVRAETLEPETIAATFSAMGFVAACRLLENIYVGCLAGLQLQVRENVVGAVLATVRAAGAVAVLAWVAPSIDAFFRWQVAVSVVSTAVMAAMAWGALPAGRRRARFASRELAAIWRFAAGMLLISSAALLLTQLDKILLSRMLSLESFGYYSLAATVAAALYLFAGPVASAYYPRFTELFTRRDMPALVDAFHTGARLVSYGVGSAAVMLVLFSDRILLTWTGQPDLVAEVAPLLRVLTIGTVLNALMWVPYQLQLAYGWTSLAAAVNVGALLVLVPAILWAVPKYGALGAAWAWAALNLGYVVFSVHFMHRRLLPAEKWRWYVMDLAVPLLTAAAVAAVVRALVPAQPGRLVEALLLVLTSAAVFAVTVAVSRRVARSRTHGARPA